MVLSFHLVCILHAFTRRHISIFITFIVAYVLSNNISITKLNENINNFELHLVNMDYLQPYTVCA